MSGVSRLSPGTGNAERELVLLLSRRCHSPQALSRAQDLLRSELDWDYMLDQSWDKEVYPLVYDNLKKLDFRNVPGRAREQLTAWYKLNAFRNQHMIEELSSLLRAFDSAGVPAIPLKGMVLAKELYGDINLRSSCDLDILVPPDLAPRALQVLEEAGYAPRLHGFQHETLKQYIESSWIRHAPVGTWVVDLHWAVLLNSRNDRAALDNLWGESSKDTFFGAPAYRMSPDWQFLFLVTHAARNTWRGIKWFADIHDMCGLHDIDWQRILNKAEVFGWGTLVRASAIGCNSLLGTPVPPDFLKEGRPSWLKLFPSTHGEVSRSMLPLYWLEGWPAKLRYFVRALLVPTREEWDFVNLPRFARFLYVPLRVGRLAVKWTSARIRVNPIASKRRTAGSVK